MRRLRNFINGEWVDSAGDDWIELVDPTVGRAQALVPAGTAADVDLAVRAASVAAPGWAATSLDERLECLERAAARLDAGIDELALLEYREMGKPLGIAADFVRAGVEVLRAAVADARSYPFTEPMGTVGHIRTVTVHRPLGVTAQIIPWNFTVTAALLGLGPLLAAGNTVVLKPSEKAPLSAERMVELLGLPPGVLNVVFGDARAGAPLAEHPLVELVHFTGSVASGQAVAVATAKRLCRAVLELGGKDPVIVDSDVDPVATAEAVAYAAFVNTGQICTSMERVYVHEAIADDFLAALVAQAEAHVSGDGAHPETKLGPLVDERQRRIVQRHVDDAVGRGAKLLVGGVVPDGPGFFYPATVLTGVTPEMLLFEEETFGPVAPVQVVSSFEEAVRLASDNVYGLAATVFTRNPAHASAAREIPAGMVWVNQWQGGGLVRMYEPARHSGMTATGGRAAFDAATRAVSVNDDVTLASAG
jgi:acyl-CoA reductase-like NAD-dependent aldehyde dehydrogenase